MECKDHIVRYPGRDGFVLIETLLNVKLRIRRNCSRLTRINRNIVECKATCRCGCTAAPLRINKNIVECKALKLAKDMIELRVLIETLWNVKYGF